MDESDGLENRCGGNVTVGSNPTPSASISHKEGPQTKNLRSFFFCRSAPDVHGLFSYVWQSPNVDQRVLNFNQLANPDYPLSDDSYLREFFIPLCVTTHHHTIFQSAVSTVGDDGHFIVLVRHFQIIHNRLESTFSSPVQRLLSAQITCRRNKSKIVSQ